MDKRKNARVGKGNIMKLEYMDAPYFMHFLNYLALTEGCKTILNLCCGSSPFGTERIDINPSSNCTRTGDMFQELKTIAKKSFDMVYIDPLWKFFNPHCKEIALNYPSDAPGFGNPFEWQYEAARIAKKFLVLQGNMQSTAINWPSIITKNVDYFLIKDSRPSGSIVQIVELKQN